jgi:hypothetical protein
MPRSHLFSFAAILLLAGCSQGFDMRDTSSSVVRLQHVFVSGGKDLMGLHASGVVISAEGHVLTTRRAVFIKDQVPGTLKYKGLFVPVGRWDRQLKVSVVWSSTELNLAVLKVDGLQRRPATFSAAAAKDRVSPGDTVYALGFPGAGDGVGDAASLRPVLTEGKVNKISPGRGVPGGAERMMVQHSASLRRGSAGGPLFDSCNRVVALNVVEPAARARVASGPGGDFVAPDSAITGTTYSPHAASIIQQFKTVPALKNIPVRTAAGACSPPSPVPLEMLVVVAALGALALLSMLLALVRRRGAGELSKVVGTYSQLIRRPGRGAMGPDGRARIGAAPSAAPAGEGWLMTGMDQEGNPVRILFGLGELDSAGAGEDGGIVIGRSHALAVKVVDDPSISRRHARVVKQDNGIAIEDLNSTYGTKVNGSPVESFTAVPLSPGDRVSLGQVHLEVSGPDSAGDS